MKVTEDNETNALITAPGVNVEHFWPGLFAMSLANLSIGTLTYNLGAGGPPVEKRVETKKEESKGSDDDMGFGLFD